MPPVLSSWAAVFAAQELMYRCEQHLSGSGFLVLIFFRGASTQRHIRIHKKGYMKEYNLLQMYFVEGKMLDFF